MIIPREEEGEETSHTSAGRGQQVAAKWPQIEASSARSSGQVWAVCGPTDFCLVLRGQQVAVAG